MLALLKKDVIRIYDRKYLLLFFLPIILKAGIFIPLIHCRKGLNIINVSLIIKVYRRGTSLGHTLNSCLYI